MRFLGHLLLFLVCVSDTTGPVLLFVVLLVGVVDENNLYLITVKESHELQIKRNIRRVNNKI